MFDVYPILSIAREFLVLILVFGALFAYALLRGKHALTALILGLYLALLISLKFPYYNAIYDLVARGGKTTPILTIAIFAVFTGMGTFLFEHLLWHDYEESAFEDISKKVILALLGTVLVMAYTYHVLPVTTIFDPGSSVAMLFAPPEYFFWLMLLPLIGLFFV